MGLHLPGVAVGQVDQLEDRYLGMVEASGSNPDLSIATIFVAVIGKKKSSCASAPLLVRHFQMNTEGGLRS